MADTILLKDGTMKVMFDWKKDITDLIEEYIGSDCAKFILHRIEVQDAEIEELRDQLDAAYDDQHYLLVDVRDEIEGIRELMSQDKINKRKINDRLYNLYAMVDGEL